MECKNCLKGIAMCYQRPCNGKPEEFEKLLDAGYANLIQKDFWYRGLENKPDVDMLTMAIYSRLDSKNDIIDMLQSCIGLNDDPIYAKYQTKHNGGKDANFNPSGKCVMLTEDNQCSLHNLGLKPEQGRDACCKNEENEKSKSNKHYSEIWDSDYGKSVVEKWILLVGYELDN